MPSHTLGKRPVLQSPRARIRSALDRSLGPRLRAAILFGSRARGDQTRDSDWDVLAIIDDDPEAAEIHREMRQLGAQLSDEIGDHVSLLTISPSEAPGYAGLLRNVERDGVRL